MKSLFKDRSIFNQLLLGGLSIMGAMVLVALIVNTHFIHRSENSSGRRWTATSVALHVRQIQQYERDFLQREINRRAYYDSGNSDALTNYKAVLPVLASEIDSLVISANSHDKDEELRLQDALKNFSSIFDETMRLNVERGRGGKGISGELNKANSAVDSLVFERWRDTAAQRIRRQKPTPQQVKIDSAYYHRMWAQSKATYANKVDREGKNYLDSVAVYSRDLVREGATLLPGLGGLVARADSLFRQSYAIQYRLGLSMDEGLRLEMKNAEKTLEQAAQEVVDKTALESDSAEGWLSVATPAVLLIGLAFAGFFFYNFATSISSAINQLTDAATEIGRGNLNSTVHIEGKNELGKLAHEFNTMSRNLADLVSAVQISGAQITNSIVEIAATAQQQQATASEVAATTSEVSATAKEISATSQELASNMKHVADVADKTADIAGNGQSGIARMEATMKQITHASESISSRLGALSEKAGNITAVVTTISKVADQTNLLSLNAAIEAEKAGEYGRGFAVVATEIRRLADQTATATNDIERIVKEMQSAVTAGVMGMDKFSEEVRRGVQASGEVGEQLSEIIQQVQTLPPNFDMVNEGMQSQTEGAQQISESLTQLGASAQQTAESLAQSARSIDQLNEAARNLQLGVAKFSLQ